MAIKSGDKRNTGSNGGELKGLLPAFIFGTIVVVGIGLLGRRATESRR